MRRLPVAIATVASARTSVEDTSGTSSMSAVRTSGISVQAPMIAFAPPAHECFCKGLHSPRNRLAPIAGFDGRDQAHEFGDLGFVR